MKDYYRTLQVHPEADDFIIKVAYRRLAQAYHPDVYKGPDAHIRMVAINEAYDVLSDPARRNEYDEQRSQRSGGSAPTATSEPPVSASWRHIMVAERLLDEIEQRTQSLADDDGSMVGRNLADSLYQECMNVLRHLDSLQGDQIEREAIDYMRASAHMTCANVRLHRPGFKDVSGWNFGGSTLGTIATLTAWGVGTAGSHTQEKANLSQALWHYQTSLGIYELLPAHMCCGFCFLDLRQPQNAIVHFQRVVELDPYGEMGIEASKELLRLGAYAQQSPGPAMAQNVWQGFGPAPPGSVATGQGLLTGASFGHRFVASLIDCIVLVFATFLIVIPLLATDYRDAAWILQIIISFAYFAGLESSRLQGTLGKAALGLRVCKLDGQPIDFLTAVLKHLLRLITTITCFFGVGLVGYLMVALTRRKQAVYELATSTLTVVGRPVHAPGFQSSVETPTNSETGSGIKFSQSKLKLVALAVALAIICAGVFLTAEQHRLSRRATAGQPGEDRRTASPAADPAVPRHESAAIADPSENISSPVTDGSGQHQDTTIQSTTSADSARRFAEPSWVIAIHSRQDRNIAEKDAETFARAGLPTGVLWIPDYPSMSGVRRWLAYVGPIDYADRTTAQRYLMTVRAQDVEAYAIRADHNSRRETFKAPVGNLNSETINGSDERLFHSTHERIVKDSDLIGKSSWQLKLMRNEPYARKGYRFRDSVLTDYFAQKPWYHGTSSDMDAISKRLTNVERSNILKIQHFEHSH